MKKKCVITVRIELSEDGTHQITQKTKGNYVPSVDYYCELLKNHCASMLYTDTLGQYKAKQKFSAFEHEWKAKLDEERNRVEDKGK